MSELRKSVLDLIGNTPLVRLNSLTKDLESEIYVKCEFLNPGGSVKDRIGIELVEDAEKRGYLKPGGTIIEGTSGNTGFGLAIAAAIKGYKCIFVMPDKMSKEKIRNLRAFGARVIVTPTAVAPDDPKSYYSVSKRLGEETPNSFYVNQYDNLANRETHIKTTGPEIWRQTGGKVDAFVAGMGTGGTISGTGKYLKSQDKNVKVVGVDPIGSILHDYFKSGEIIEAKPYTLEGIGEDILPKNLDFDVIDDVVQVTDKESFLMTRELLLKEGIFAGMSSGAAVAGALKYAKKVGGKKRIVVILPDSGNRYLSKVFDDDWMRENGYLEESFGSVRDLLSILNKGKDKVITALAEDTVDKIVQVMRDRGISQLPILKGKKVVGLVSESKLLSELFSGKVKGSDPVSNIVEESFVAVSLTDDVMDLSRSISKGDIPIVIENGQIKAIVTKIDLISYLGGMRQAR